MVNSASSAQGGLFIVQTRFRGGTLGEDYSIFASIPYRWRQANSANRNERDSEWIIEAPPAAAWRPTPAQPQELTCGLTSTPAYLLPIALGLAGNLTTESRKSVSV